MNDTEKCSKCGKAKEAPGAGMATQLLDLCICAMQEKEQMATISICASCGKRIATRDGSMTQWIFGSEKCGCIRPIINQKQIDSFVVPGFEEMDLEGDEIELEIDPDSFPLQRYKPLIELGKGASGTVYLCRDRLLKKRVAIKTLHTQNDEQLVSFQEEAKNTAKMNHPNIVKILDFGATDAGTPYMVMDYVPGISLEKFIEDREKLSPETAAPIFEKLAEALIYAHDRRTFHRDIKPSNIILLEAGNEINVQLIDFGIAKVKETTGSITTYDNKSLAGTPYYMAPDLILNKKYDARSEVYSLGCVLFEALYGKPPFVGESVLDVLNMHANKEAPTLENVPEKLSNLVAKCLSKEQEKRFQSMTDFKNALAKTISSGEKPDSQTAENEKPDSKKEEKTK